MGHTIQLDYKDGLPAWRLRLVQPERFRDVEYSIQVRLFVLPKGALLAVLLKFYDIPDQPYFVHRVMDLTDGHVVRHAAACAREGRIVIQFETVGEQQGFERTLELRRDVWETVLKEGKASRDGKMIDGEDALESFLKVFRPVSEKDGVEAGWAEVDRVYPAA